MTRLEQALQRARANVAELQDKTDDYSRTMLGVWQNQVAILEQQLEEAEVAK